MHYLIERPNRVNRGLLTFPRSVDDLFERFWDGTNPSQVPTAWQPAVDVLETPQAYLLRAELPGIDPDEIDVTLVGDTLILRGEKPVQEATDDQAWRLSERWSGQFERSFKLPAPLSTDDIQAEARHGVLTIKVMKAEAAQPRKIAIRST